jgi:hypothetical protein
MDVQIFCDFRHGHNFIVVLHLATLWVRQGRNSRIRLNSSNKFPLGLLLPDFVTKGNSRTKASSLCAYGIKANVRIADRTAGLLGGNRVVSPIARPNPVMVGESSQSVLGKTPRIVEQRRRSAIPELNQDEGSAGKNTSVRASMLSRAGASAELVGSANAVWAVKRVRPGSES